MNDTWETRDPVTGRHHRNGHVLILSETDWVCLICGHHFDAAVDAELFFCGDDCTGRHYGDTANVDAYHAEMQRLQEERKRR